VELDRLVRVDRGDATGRGASVDGVPVTEVSAQDHLLELLVDGRTQRAVVDVQPHVVEVAHHGQRFVLTPPDPFADDTLTADDGTLVAPMPGTVLSVDVAPGQRVTEGETLGIMEAMKMELALKAPFDGTVAQVGASVGDQVKLGAMLFVVEE
jgi:biotin carboxyl carrier protein